MGILVALVKEPRGDGMLTMPAEKFEGVNILNPGELLACAQDHTEGGRRRLAEAVSHFFSEKELNATERNIAGEILLNLVRQAEQDLREALAERLALHENIPPQVMVYLANDDISVAQSVLMHSPVLKDVDLMYVISAKGADYWQAISQRESISPMLADRLIDTGDPSTALNLIDNQRVNLQKGSMKKLMKVALRSEELHAPLMRRPEIDGELAIDLYMVVSHALRQEITRKFSIPATIVDQATEEMIHELSNETRGHRETTVEMLALAKRFQERKDITADLMIKTLRRGQVGFFLALLAQKTQLTPDVLSRLMDKDGGKPFVVACRSIGMMKSEFASIFLLSRGIRKGDKIVDQRDLAMALKAYDTLKDHDISRIMSSWIKNPELV